MKLQQASMNRQDVNIKLAEFTVLQEIARKIVMLDRKYMTQKTYEAIIGEPDAGFYKIPLEYINRCYVMKPVGSSITHIKEVRQNQIKFALETLMNPAVAQIGQMNVRPFTVDYYEVLKEALDVADVKTVDRILLLQQQQQQDPMMGMVQQILGNPQIIQSLQGVGYGQQ